MAMHLNIGSKGKDRPAFFAGSDRTLNISVLLLLLMGIILVYAATRDWFRF